MGSFEDNTRRVNHARAALAAYPGTDPHDVRTSIVDLIADLMHLADAEGEEGVIESAEMHYEAEVEGS